MTSNEYLLDFFFRREFREFVAVMFLKSMHLDAKLHISVMGWYDKYWYMKFAWYLKKKQPDLATSYN